MRKLLQLVLPLHLVRLFKKHKPTLQLLILKWEKPKRQHWKNSKNKRTTIYWLQGHIQFKKNHGIQFQSGPYGNESSCSNFIKAIWILFQKDIYIYIQETFMSELHFHILWWKYRLQHQWTSCIHFFCWSRHHRT